MILNSLKLYHFRCHSHLELKFDPTLNIISGLNGEGKTSILEAIGMLSHFKSFRMAKTSELVQKGQSEASISGKAFNPKIGTFDISIQFKENKKSILINHKKCDYLSQYFGKFYAVIFSPSDLEIIRGGPEMRRSWIDRAASIFFSDHVEILLRYNTLLKQRNSILRKFSTRLLKSLPSDFEIWSEQLSLYGAKIMQNRKISLNYFAPKISEFYERISNQCKFFFFNYKSEISTDGMETPELAQALLERFQTLFSKESILGTTLVGPHRDDVTILVENSPIKSYASQGEVRTFVLSMRLAEVEIYQEWLKNNPVLLIDDFSSELDHKRREFLLDFISKKNLQVFITTTEKLALGLNYHLENHQLSQ